MPDNPNPRDWETSSDAVVYEFSDVAERLPPGTPAPPRPGRLTKAQIDELLKRQTPDTIVQEFTHSPGDEPDDDSPESRA